VTTRLRLQSGTLLTRLGRLRGKSQFVIETPGAVTAARGTRFLVEARPGLTVVLVQEGSVGVSAARAPAAEVSVGPDTKVLVRQAPPSRAEPVDDADRVRLRELEQLGAVVDRQTEPILAEVDRLIAAGRLDEAEWAATNAARLAWGRRNGLRAVARAHAIGMLRGVGFLGPIPGRLCSATDVLQAAWAWKGDPPPLRDDERVRAGLAQVRDFVLAGLRDPIAAETTRFCFDEIDVSLNHPLQDWPRLIEPLMARYSKSPGRQLLEHRRLYALTMTGSADEKAAATSTLRSNVGNPRRARDLRCWEARLLLYLARQAARGGDSAAIKEWAAQLLAVSAGLPAGYVRTMFRLQAYANLDDLARAEPIARDLIRTYLSLDTYYRPPASQVRTDIGVLVEAIRRSNDPAKQAREAEWWETLRRHGVP
jgi:hypothetical protein